MDLRLIACHQFASAGGSPRDYLSLNRELQDQPYRFGEGQVPDSIRAGALQLGVTQFIIKALLIVQADSDYRQR